MNSAIAAISSSTMKSVTRRSSRRQHVGGDRHVHMDAEPVAGRGAEERQATMVSRTAVGFGPRRGAVENVAGENRPRDDRRNQHQRDARDDDAERDRRGPSPCGKTRPSIPPRWPVSEPDRMNKRGPASGLREPGRALSDDERCYFVSWMRLTMSAYFGPYLSHTGLTASWNAFLSAAETWMISMPAALALSIACFS